MSIKKVNAAPSSSPQNNKTTAIQRKKLAALFNSDNNNNNNPSNIQENNQYYETSRRNSSDAHSVSTTPSNYYINYNSNLDFTNSNPCSASSSPYTVMSSPWTEPSPYLKSPWIHQIPDSDSEAEHDENEQVFSKLGLIGSLFREEGHIYSLAAAGNLLYTGSDSRNIRVWRDLQDFSGFKSSSGLVKAIVVFKDRIFTGHQDGRIRVWRNKGRSYKRVGSLPTTRDLLVKSVNPKSYVQVRRHKNVPWIKHYDAVSCMGIDVEQGLLYSGSWDKTLKVWRISDFKCLESIHAHDDAVNSVVVGFDGLVFTGSADGKVKAWRREHVGKYNEHVLVETLLRQDHAVTSLVVSHAPVGAVYAGSSDGLVSFWEREKHFMSYGGVLRGHKMAVLCLASAGSLVMSGSVDKSICVWRKDGGGVHSCAAVLTGHSGPVKCLAVEKEVEEEKEEEEESDRWILYSGSLDKSIKVWRVAERALSR